MPISDESLENLESLTRQQGRPLRPGPQIPGHTIQHDEAQHSWIIDQMLVACSPIEDTCFAVLLEQANRAVPFAHFAAALGEQGPLDESGKMRIQHAMSGLRPKVWVLDMDIISLRGIGYLLLSDGQDGDHSLENREL